MAISAQEMALRVKIVNVALDILDAGSHYYWGAPDAGQVPMAANDFSPDATKRHVLAASLNGTNFCAGRCDSRNLQSLTKWKGSNAKDLAAANGGAFVFPRYYLDGDTKHPSPSAAVWGEDCTGKLHFDCASFVRHCYRTVLGTAIMPKGIIMMNVAEQIWPLHGGPKTIGGVDILPADIVYTNSGHVGLATGSDVYTVTLPRVPNEQSIHAYYAKVGVIQTPIAGPDPHWNIVRRWKNWGLSVGT